MINKTDIQIEILRLFKLQMLDIIHKTIDDHKSNRFDWQKTEKLLSSLMNEFTAYCNCIDFIDTDDVLKPFKTIKESNISVPANRQTLDGINVVRKVQNACAAKDPNNK